MSTSRPSASLTQIPAHHHHHHHHAASASTGGTVHRNRQYTHLNAQLAQLNAQMADMESLVAMTAVQADYIKGLGAWWGGTFMAASKILGEETASGANVNASTGAGVGAGAGTMAASKVEK